MCSPSPRLVSSRCRAYGIRVWKPCAVALSTSIPANTPSSSKSLFAVSRSASAIAASRRKKNATKGFAETILHELLVAR